MPSNLLHKLIYALLSGFTELLPVSARPHQLLYETMTGIPMTDAMVSFSVHLGVLVAVWISCRAHIHRLMRENRIQRTSRRRRRQRTSDRIALLDIQILKTSAIPVIISLFFYAALQRKISGLAPLALTLILNGLLLLLPEFSYRGNKDGRTFSRLDSLLVGLGGALGAVPGFSHMGGIVSVGLMRGADRGYILNLGYLLSIPLLTGLAALDLYAFIQTKAALTALAVLIYTVMAATAFAGAYLCILLMRYLFTKATKTSFCYYSFGVALFSFILYLMI